MSCVLVRASRATSVCDVFRGLWTHLRICSALKPSIQTLLRLHSQLQSHIQVYLAVNTGGCNHPFSHATVENLSELNSTCRHISGRGSRWLHRRGRLKSSVNYFVIPCHVRRTLLHRRNVIMCSVSGRWPPQANRVKIIDFSKTSLILSCSQRAGLGGFPIVLGGISYRIRILLYRDVSCMYPACTL